MIFNVIFGEPLECGAWVKTTNLRFADGWGLCCLNISSLSFILCPKKNIFWKFFTSISPSRINTVKTDWEMSTAYIFRLKRGTTAVSIFSLLFWLFHLGGCKNPPSWNSRLPGTAQAACSTVILLKCDVIAWSSLLSSSSFLSFHFFHFSSFMSMFFISNSLSCVLLSLSFDSKLLVPI